MNSKVLPAVAVLIAIGVFFVYVNPLWTGKIAETNAAIAADKQVLQAAADYFDQERVLTDARNQIDAAGLDRLQKFLPDSADNVQVIIDVNAIASKSGLTLSNINVNSQSQEAGDQGIAGNVNPVSDVEITLSALGTYSSFKTFLGALESSLRLIDVRDLTITGSDTGTYAYSMKLRIYWLHE